MLEAVLARKRLTNQATRLLRTAIGALCLLQNPGCGGDAERNDEVSRDDSGASGGGVIPVVRMEVPSQKVEPPSQRVADSTPEPEAPIATDVEAPDPRLTRTLDPEYSAQRLAEISKLKAGGDDLESVLDALESDPDPAVRVAAADLLAESQRREAIDGLLRALDDPSKAVVVQALQTLSLVGESDIIPWIEPLLDNPDPEISGPAERTCYFAGGCGDDESDPNYGEGFAGLPEANPVPDPRYDYQFGPGSDSEE